jgi:hypothetical protein
MLTFGFNSKELSQAFASAIEDKEDLEETKKIVAITKSCRYITR